VRTLLLAQLLLRQQLPRKVLARRQPAAVRRRGVPGRAFAALRLFARLLRSLPAFSPPLLSIHRRLAVLARGLPPQGNRASPRPHSS